MSQKFQDNNKENNNLLDTKIQDVFKRALEFHKKGQLENAKTLYENILKKQPNHFDSLHFLGIIYSQKNYHEKAVVLISKAIGLNPNNANFYSNRGLALKDLKKLDAAIESFDGAISIKPDLFEAHYNRGNALQELKRLDAAIESYDIAITIKPDDAEAYFKRGNALQELKQLDAAIASYDKAIAVKPNHAKAYSNRGNALQDLKQIDAAVASFEQAITIKPDYAGAYYNRGNALQELKQMEAAIASYDQAIAIKPDFPEAHYNRGNALQELKQLDAAIESYDKAIAIKPDDAEAYFKRGNTLQELKQLEASIASYERAIVLKSNYAEAYSNRGIALKEHKQLNAALASFDGAIAIKPDYADAYWNKALALLLAGDFDNGWELYEWRWKREKFTSFRSNFTKPLWLGTESLEGKTILLHSEQGLGDTIQFCRYAKLVSDLGARVVMEVEDPLVSLLKTLNGVDEIVTRGSPLPEFDYHCPLLSLPLAFKTNIDSIPFATNYLPRNSKKVAYWERKLEQKNQPRVGLVWSGSTTHKNDHNRSILLSELMQRLPNEFQYVSLQKDVREIDKITLQSQARIIHFGDELIDFADTAALCEQLDVVISVDTSVAHLGGAMGKPTWVMLPFSPDWRWLLDRDDSPWYSTMRLYRQESTGDWDGVFSRLQADLEKFII